MFNGYDFIYDGKSSISENVKMLYTESNPFEFTKSIPDKEISLIHTAQSGRWHITGISTPEPLSFQMQIMMYSDDVDLYANGNPVIKRNHISRISHWLFDNTEFKKLQILTDDMRDLYFMAIFKDVEYFEAGGDVCGFRATVLCDTIGAYEERVITKTCSDRTEFVEQCLHDGIYEIQPVYTIGIKDSEPITIGVNGQKIILQNLTVGSEVVIDAETLITTSSAYDNLYVEDRFNKCFPILKWGKNSFVVQGNCSLKIKYKTRREVGC
jgi:phage-related protein